MCAICGVSNFKNQQDYKYHYKTVHSVHMRIDADIHISSVKKEIKPVKVTNRTKKQIVDDAENSWLKSYIVN